MYTHRPLEWKIGPWSGCSRTCGGGVETRTVSCVRESVTGVQYMNQDFCPESPALHRSCNTDQCPRWQIMTDWSECSVTCATGETIRLVQCRDYNGNQVHGCPIYAKPIERKLCLTRLPCLEGPYEDVKSGLSVVIEVFLIIPCIHYLAIPLAGMNAIKNPAKHGNYWKVNKSKTSFANYEIKSKSQRISLHAQQVTHFLTGVLAVNMWNCIRTRNVTCAMYVSHTETLEERPEHDCEPLLAIKPTTPQKVPSLFQQLVTDTDADIFDATTFATGTERNYEIT
ncbi:putative ADAMTS-like protein 1 [Apostichopus japonicus]|uniref:Putative ADAMTS-like protein 1 n=1 Tax=Stichopus japonicus TaxID=307972 RepID=A0A2G8JWP5_STIJA|nr:putative ADAMTS-like protein 1 [Apostichopus japonicus]